MLKTSTFLVFCGLIVAAAVVHGAVTQRWSAFEPDPTVTKRLHALQVRFEDWKASEEKVPTEMPANERSIATSYQYSSVASGRTAIVTLISGIPGSVSTHTPDVCYPGSGYSTLRSPRKETMTLPDGRTAEYYVADFEKKRATKHDRVRVRWAWSIDGTWVAPDRPRWQFAAALARVPVLYKIYLATPLPDEGEGRPEDDATTRRFISTALMQYASAFGK